MRLQGRMQFTIIIWGQADPNTPITLQRMLVSRNIRGAILSRLPLEDQRVVLPWHELVCVSIGFKMRETKMHAVLSHDLNSMRLAVTEAARRGYQRIGFAAEANVETWLGDGWLGGFMIEQVRHPERNAIPPCLSPGGDRQVFRNWVQKHHPDVIISNHLDLIQMLKEDGIRIPQDIGWIHLGDPVSEPGMAHIHHEFLHLSKAAVDLIVVHLYRNETGLPEVPRTLLIEDGFQDGWSLRDLRETCSN